MILLIIVPADLLIFHLLLPGEIIPVFLPADGCHFLLFLNLTLDLGCKLLQFFLIQKILIKQQVKPDAGKCYQIAVLLFSLLLQALSQHNRNGKSCGNAAGQPGQLLRFPL